ncbi:hypothetical protein AHAS_Ahas10G0129900 [Arachis hypogaea]
MENSKALLEIERIVPIQQQQQQLLLNGKEIRNSDELRAIGMKDDDLFVMVCSGVGNGDGGAASCLVDEELSKKVKGLHPFELVVWFLSSSFQSLGSIFLYNCTINPGKVTNNREDGTIEPYAFHLWLP